MTLIARLALLLKNAPAALWFVLLGAAFMTGAIGLGRHVWNARYESGVSFGADSVTKAADARVQEYRIIAQRARAQVDTVVRTVEVQAEATQASVGRARDAVAALPDSVRAIPAVARLSAEVTILTADVDSLMALRVTERAAYTAVLTADSLMIQAQAVQLHALATANIQLQSEVKRRVTKPRVVVIATAALGAGLALGKWVLR